jgi:hypothetical protein
MTLAPLFASCDNYPNNSIDFSPYRGRPGSFKVCLMHKISGPGRSPLEDFDAVNIISNLIQRVPMYTNSI